MRAVFACRALEPPVADWKHVADLVLRQARHPAGVGFVAL